jgi:hypothetical protein
VALEHIGSRMTDRLLYVRADARSHILHVVTYDSRARRPRKTPGWETPAERLHEPPTA